MTVGTAEPIESESVVTKKRIARPGGGSGGRNDNNGGGGDDGGDHADRFDGAGSGANAAERSKVLGWFVLLVVLMTFGVLFGTYIVIATNRGVEWRPFDLPMQIWFSTALILASSFTFFKATTSLDDSHQLDARKWLLATTALGGVFVASQLLVWLTLVNRGYYLSGNQYAGFFYILTGIHAIHILGGIVALGWAGTRLWYETTDALELSYRQSTTRSISWYWHLMGILWVALFALLAIWK